MQKINIFPNEVKRGDPTDLMTIKEICLKHKFKYSYLYKWAHEKCGLTLYYRGAWMLSESEVLEFCRKQKEARLGRNK